MCVWVRRPAGNGANMKLNKMLEERKKANEASFILFTARMKNKRVMVKCKMEFRWRPDFRARTFAMNE